MSTMPSRPTLLRTSTVIPIASLETQVRSRIRAELKRQGMSINVLGRLGGFGRTSVYHALEGRRRMTLNDLGKMSAVLDVTPAQLLEDAEGAEQ